MSLGDHIDKIYKQCEWEGGNGLMGPFYFYSFIAVDLGF